MKKNIVFLFCMTFYATEIFGQTKLLDSLQLEAEMEKDDSSRIEKIFFYTRVLAKVDLEKTIHVIEKIRTECLRKKLTFLYCKSFSAAATAYFDVADYPHSVLNFEKAVELLHSLPESKIRSLELATAFLNTGAAYSNFSEIDSAQIFYLRSANFYEKLNDSLGLMYTYFNLAYIFVDILEYEKAYEYIVKSKNFINDYREKYDQPICTVTTMASISYRLGKKNAGQKLLKLCDSIFKFSSLNLSKVYYYNAYGCSYYYSNNFEKAIWYHKKSYDYSVEWGDPYFIADEAWELGRAYLKLNQPDSAKRYLDTALRIARTYNYLPKIRFITRDWCEYYASIGDYKKAYELRTGLQVFTDSMINVQNHNRILLNDARYESERKENAIKELEQNKKIQTLSIKQKNTLNYFLLGAAATLLLIVLLLYRNYRQKRELQLKQIKELEQEKQLIATDSILKAQEEERTRMAKDLHDGLGGMLSGIKLNLSAMKGNMIIQENDALLFSRSITQLDNAISEMRRVAHNMMPEALLKFGLGEAIQDYCDSINESNMVKMKYTQIGSLQGLSQSAEIVLYRIIQELTNNALKHASAKNIFIQITKHLKGFTITVEDDGKGFDSKTLPGEKGTGLKNVRSRVEYLKGSFTADSEHSKGTSMIIEIPDGN